MAYPINPGDIIEYTIVMQMDGQTCLNVYHYRYIEGQTPIADGASKLQTFADDEITSLVSPYAATKNNVTSTVTFVGLRVQKIFPTRQAFVFGVGGGSGAGGADELPSGVAGCITLRGEAAGRGKAGRKEVPGMQVENVANGSFTPTGITRLSDIATSALLDRELDGPTKRLEPVIFNRITPADSQLIVSAVPQPTVRFLTRRTVGRGI